MNRYPFKISALAGLVEKYFGEYLRDNPDIIPDTESLAAYLGITRDDLNVLEECRKTARTVRSAKTRIAAAKKQLAFRGKLPASVLAFDLRNDHGYRDKPEDAVTATLVLRGLADEWSE